MEGFGILLIGYWGAVVMIFLIGLIKIIVAAINGTSLKNGLKLLILSVIMVVIGAGACALMMSGIGTM
ncbi:hypothetical protein ACXZ1K_07310 [Pedobacter sp. PWIIR3]